MLNYLKNIFLNKFILNHYFVIYKIKYDLNLNLNDFTKFNIINHLLNYLFFKNKYLKILNIIYYFIIINQFFLIFLYYQIQII